MKLDQKAFEVTSTLDSEGESSEMSIHKDSLQHIMDILTRLYPNPIKAVVREYATNALDSHIQAGQSKPIEIKLPTDLNPTLSIRDFGVGLSKDEILYQYSAYGFSTKRESNEQTGALGLGCKSALCVTSQFHLRSIKDGALVVALIGRNDKGSGTFKIVHESITEEENGVTISIPVPNGDITTYTKEAVEFFALIEPERYKLLNCRYDPSSFFEPKKTSSIANIKSLSEEFEDLLSVVKVYSFKKRGIFESNNRMTKMAGDSFGEPSLNNWIATQIRVRMGDVNYPVKNSIIKDSVFISLFAKYGLLILLEADLGELSIAPQREELLYDRKTEQWITSKIEQIGKTYVAKIQSIIDKAESGQQAIEVLASFYNSREYDDLLKTGHHFMYKNRVIPAGIGPIDSSTIAYWKKSSDQTRHIFTHEDSKKYLKLNRYQVFKEDLTPKQRRELTGAYYGQCSGEISILGPEIVKSIILIEDVDKIADDVINLSNNDRKKLQNLAIQKDLGVHPDNAYFLLSNGKLRFEKSWTDNVFTWEDVEEAWKNRPKEAKTTKKTTASVDKYTIFTPNAKGKTDGFYIYKKDDISEEDLPLYDIKGSKYLDVLIFIPAAKRRLERVRITLSYKQICAYINTYHPTDERVRFIVAPRNKWRPIMQQYPNTTTIDEYATKHFQNGIDAAHGRRTFNNGAYGYSIRGNFKIYSLIRDLKIDRSLITNKRFLKLFEEVDNLLGVDEKQKEIPRDLTIMDQYVFELFRDIRRHEICRTTTSFINPGATNLDKTQDDKSKLGELKKRDEECLSQNILIGAIGTLVGNTYGWNNSLNNSGLDLEKLKEEIVKAINESENNT